MKRNFNDVLLSFEISRSSVCVCVCCHTVSREKVVAVIWFQSVVTLNLSWTSHMKGLRHLITESHIVTG